MKKLISKLIKFRNDDKKNIELIKNSDLFDEKYYLNDNPDIKIDAATHYYYYGFKDGKSPSFNFSNDYYLETYKDIKEVGINPLLHYLRYGKLENRTIKKDNGVSLKELYYKNTNFPYNYNIYLCNNDIRRINLFIDDNVDDAIDLFKYLEKYFKENNYQLRIIYSNCLLDRLKDTLVMNRIKIPDNTEYLYLKPDNYLFVSNADKYIATSYKAALALLNTPGLDTCIYYYYNTKYYNVEEAYYNQYVIKNPNIMTITSKDVDYIDSYSLNIVVKGNLGKKIYYHSNMMFLLGIEWLNSVFMKEVLDNHKYIVTVLNNDIKFHFDSDIDVFSDNIMKIPKTDSVFEIFSDLKKEPIIVCNLKKDKENIKTYNVLEKDIDILNNEQEQQKYIDKNYSCFELTMKKCGEEDV